MSELCTRFDEPARAAAWCEEARSSGATIGFVPTMGALHAGHLSLVERAAKESDHACVSVFVNPLQFDQPEDLESYPRDIGGDRRALSEVGCSMVFTGTLEGFFPEAPSPEAIELRVPGPEAEGLEGTFRPGHFAGVATICARLFELVRPERAYFGEKDFQQCLVVRRLAEELGFPEIVVCPTAREPGGLAMSSRNLRLNDEERVQARALSQALFAAREAWRGGERDASALRALLHGRLDAPGIDMEYGEVRDPSSWSASSPEGPLSRARALVAATVGPVRLIDNLELS